MTATTLQISANISRETKKMLDSYVRKRGIKKSFVIEQALRHHLVALSEIPEEFIIPPTLVVTADSFEKLFKKLKSPPNPTAELRTLMRGDAISEDGLH